MAESRFGLRLRKAWNVLSGKDNSMISEPYAHDIGPGSSRQPFRHRIITGSERTIISSIYTRIAIDVAMTKFEHVIVDDEDRYEKTVDDGLNQVMTLEANIDQTSVSFMLDLVISMLDEGVVAVVPVDTDNNPLVTDSYDIYTMRTAKIIGWHPYFVDLELYNDATGQTQMVTMPKRCVAIIENPFYSVMNEPNSTLQRLVYKLGLLDAADARTNSSKLDLIVQLPYSVKGEVQRDRAAKRKADIEHQLTDTKYGIAYIDATEKITQLNRPIENGLLDQIKALTDQLYSQLSINSSIMDGTANAETMNNYFQRTVSVIIDAIKLEFQRKFLSKNSRTLGHRIMSSQDPFRYLTVTQIAQLVDSLSRNEVLTGNEFRSALGFKPSSEPSADELRNKNLIDVDAAYGQTGPEGDPYAYQDPSVEEDQNGM